MNFLTKNDWNIIKKQYHLAYERIGQNQKLIGHPENDRDLYDCFDDNGIYVYPTWFGFNICGIKDDVLNVFLMIKGVEDMAARVDAEKSAFMRAFELLNKKLLEEYENKRH